MDDKFFFKTLLIPSGFLLVTSLVVLPLVNIHLDYGSFIPVVGMLVLFLSGAALYRYRKMEKLYFLLMVSFWGTFLSNLYILPMYAAARLPVAFRDETLAWVDGLMGLEAPVALDFMARYPFLSLVSQIVYFSMLFFFVLSLLALPLVDQKERARQFLLSLLVCALISLPLYMLVPARYAWFHYGYSIPQAHMEAHRQMIFLKGSGAFTLAMGRIQGLISFPSFHTILPVLCALALWRVRYCRWVGGVLAVLIPLSAWPSGGHYFIDILAGVAVAFTGWFLAGWWLGEKELCCS